MITEVEVYSIKYKAHIWDNKIKKKIPNTWQNEAILYWYSISHLHLSPKMSLKLQIWKFSPEIIVNVIYFEGSN